MPFTPSNLSSSLFPGLGYFGTTGSDSIDIRLDEKIRSIRIFLPETGRPGLLNLTRLELHGRSGLLALDEHEVQATQSTVYNDDPRFGPDNLLSGKGIHTKSEPSPWWQASFVEPVSVSRLRLYNRRDRWGARSRHAVIRIETESRRIDVRDPCTAEHAIELLRDCMETCGPVVLESDPAILRRRILVALSERIRAPETALDTLPWRSLLPLVRMWDPCALDEHEMTLIGAWLTQCNGLGPLLPMAEKLGSPAQILRLQGRINEIAALRGGEHHIITRHGIQRSYLLSRRDAFLQGATRLIEQLHGMDYQPMLSYGTLLGAVRNQSFIAHDDDLDLLMLCNAQDQAGVTREISEVAEQLRRAGYRVEILLPQSLNMHVRDEAAGVTLDLFPCWRSQPGLVSLHMEKMTLRAIPESIVLPTGVVTLHGHELPAPACPEDFLHARYGEHWRTPDPFFEWPWPLSTTP